MFCHDGCNPVDGLPRKSLTILCIFTHYHKKLYIRECGLGTYDMMYRRQATNRGSLNWGVVDMALYNEAFVGWTKTILRGWYCLVDTHTSLECIHAPQEGSPWNTSHSVDVCTGHSPSHSLTPIRLSNVEICIQCSRRFLVPVSTVSLCTLVLQMQAPTFQQQTVERSVH